MYEVVIGGWNGTKSVIRSQKQSNEPLAELTHDESILDCNEFREFYLTWTEGNIEVGTPDSETPLMSYSPEDGGFPVQYLFVSGWKDNSSNIQWNIGKCGLLAVVVNLTFVDTNNVGHMNTSIYLSFCLTFTLSLSVCLCLCFACLELSLYLCL
eukprot:TRINITY_DN109608_c0_g1_i2.p1 TRINITY_DN109608_c0_g1~~TRINITY_DN109608_c0_g1_i2.p1  ORF type:complete len:154 (-),score=22.13 TRINITY_DN109608_c0_g1_i2:515-976(-)